VPGPLREYGICALLGFALPLFREVQIGSSPDRASDRALLLWDLPVALPIAVAVFPQVCAADVTGYRVVPGFVGADKRGWVSLAGGSIDSGRAKVRCTIQGSGSRLDTRLAAVQPWFESAADSRPRNPATAK
jgi:hypothetical protein